jgi:phage-related protein
MNYSIVYYEKESGECPVREFIQQFDAVREMPAIYARMALLEEHGPQLKRPYADFLRDKIYELPFKIAKRQMRILYFFALAKAIILTNAFIKKTKNVPENEIERAIRFRRDYLIKHGETP